LPAHFAALLGQLTVDDPFLNHGPVKGIAKVSTRRKICVKKAVKKSCTFGSIDLHRGNFLGNFEPPGGIPVNRQPSS
jgi:hypothetical protein